MSDENENENQNAPASDDELLAFIERNTVTTNDAVAGETIDPGAGEGNDGPTGGSPREFQPEYHEHDAVDDQNDAPQDLDDGESDLGDDGL
ncbi:hypothetical protein [Gryllotalpicola protaetiae]|uniref:Uncharacterized protein n=1 Tax=Gryllotalpicola protaetiae TaxID=2419771 RepID=A0A387BTK3_9MICO|nr:hypothetical protein [Gryllotalpicola protaetiae]AYG04369.1 hypothetical protein D7I44_13085 [Gryllotalpicola protaetiae]